MSVALPCHNQLQSQVITLNGILSAGQLSSKDPNRSNKKLQQIMHVSGCQMDNTPNSTAMQDAYSSRLIDMVSRNCMSYIAATQEMNANACQQVLKAF